MKTNNMLLLALSIVNGGFVVLDVARDKITFVTFFSAGACLFSLFVVGYALGSDKYR